MNTPNSAHRLAARLSMGLLVVIALAVFALVGCEGPVGPEGPEGPRGEQGERGPAGSANVTSETLTLQASAFTTSRSDLTTTITHPVEVSALSSTVVTSGVVLVYLEYALGDVADVWQPLPFTEGYSFSDGSAAILNFRFLIPEDETFFDDGNAAIAIEALRVISSGNVNDITSDLDGARLRIVTVPPSTAASAGVSQGMSYSELMNRLKD